jgi:hypothetical protein
VRQDQTLRERGLLSCGADEKDAKIGEDGLLWRVVMLVHVPIHKNVEMRVIAHVLNLFLKNYYFKYCKI